MYYLLSSQYWQHNAQEQQGGDTDHSGTDASSTTLSCSPALLWQLRLSSLYMLSHAFKLLQGRLLGKLWDGGYDVTRTETE